MTGIGRVEDIEQAPRPAALDAAAAAGISTREALLCAASVAAITIYLSFNAGGFFVTAPAAVAIVLLAALLVRTTTARAPFAGVGRATAIAVTALALFAAWTFISALWSKAWGATTIELDRALLYVTALLVYGALPARAGRLRALLGGLVAAIAAVAVVALVTRLLPTVWPVSPDAHRDRLSYPLTYWNALGLLAGLGFVGALHFATDGAERIAVRVAATTLLPLLATVLYFTLSRGPMAVTALGALLFLAVARPRAVLPVLLAAIPPAAAVLVVSYHADALTSDAPTSSQAVHEGHRVALVLAAALVATAVLRLALARVEHRIPVPRWPLPVRPWVAGAVAVAIAVAALAVSGEGKRALDSFGNTDALSTLHDQRGRLVSLSNNGRFDHWRVALDAFAHSPLHGTGAGTYKDQWAQHRKEDFVVINAHSLYLQALGELGAPGLLLLVVALVAIAVALGRRLRGPERAVGAAVLAMVAMWLVHAGIDWDWEMPAVSWWVFALGGVAMAAGDGRSASVLAGGWARRNTLRLVLGLGCLLLMVTPVRLVLSQRHLDRAAAAFARDDCDTTIDEGLAAISVLSVRPQPYELVGLCDVRLGANALAVRMVQSAVDRDPGDWEYRYALALVQGAAGIDPRAAARRAHELDPLEPRTSYALTLYDHGEPGQWRARALAAPLPP